MNTFKCGCHFLQLYLDQNITTLKIQMYFYRTRVRSLAMLVTHSLTHWLTHSVTFSRLDGCEKVFQVGEKNRVTFLQLIKAVKLSKGGKCTIWSWHVSPPTHVTECGKFWFLLLLLNWIWKIPSPDKCLFFGGKFNKKKLNFCSDFEHKISSRFWSWSSGKI